MSLAGIGSLRGAHNWQNAAVAYALARSQGLDAATIASGLKSFGGLAHRMEQVARAGAVLFVNNSKATNADATAKALASFTDIYWIVGGRPKSGGLSGLEPFFPRSRPRLSDRRGGGRLRCATRLRGGSHPLRHARARDRSCRCRRRALLRRGAGRAVVAGVRLLRSVCEFRGARDALPRLRHET